MAGWDADAEITYAVDYRLVTNTFVTVFWQAKNSSEKVIVGGLNTGVPLTGLADAKKIKANRDKAYRTCSGIKNFPNFGNPNFECDEFPSPAPTRARRRASTTPFG